MQPAPTAAGHGTATAVPTPTFPITLTEKACAMVQQAMAEEEGSVDGLRIGVIGGGCSGLQYLLDFTPGVTEDDWVDEQNGVKVLIDPFSAGHLSGTTIDYVDGLTGTGFKFENPNVVRACGCGSSFQT